MIIVEDLSPCLPRKMELLLKFLGATDLWSPCASQCGNEAPWALGGIDFMCITRWIRCELRPFHDRRKTRRPQCPCGPGTGAVEGKKMS